MRSKGLEENADIQTYIGTYLKYNQDGFCTYISNLRQFKSIFLIINP